MGHFITASAVWSVRMLAVRRLRDCREGSLPRFLAGKSSVTNPGVAAAASVQTGRVRHPVLRPPALELAQVIVEVVVALFTGHDRGRQP